MCHSWAFVFCWLAETCVTSAKHSTSNSFISQFWCTPRHHLWATWLSSFHQIPAKKVVPFQMIPGAIDLKWPKFPLKLESASTLCLDFNLIQKVARLSGWKFQKLWEFFRLHKCGAHSMVEPKTQEKHRRGRWPEPGRPLQCQFPLRCRNLQKTWTNSQGLPNAAAWCRPGTSCSCWTILTSAS